MGWLDGLLGQRHFQLFLFVLFDLLLLFLFLFVFLSISFAFLYTLASNLHIPHNLPNRRSFPNPLLSFLISLPFFMFRCLPTWIGTATPIQQFHPTFRQFLILEPENPFQTGQFPIFIKLVYHECYVLVYVQYTSYIFQHYFLLDFVQVKSTIDILLDKIFFTNVSEIFILNHDKKSEIETYSRFGFFLCEGVIDMLAGFCYFCLDC